MKARILAILVLLAVLVSCITACTTKDSYLVKVMKRAPENAKGVYCTYILSLAEDPDVSFAYDEIISSLDYVISFVETSDISVYAEFGFDGEEIIVLFGDFYLKDLRNALTEEDYVEGEYKGIEIWTDDYDDAVTFIDNMIVSGYEDLVKACIRVYKKEESSLYDNEDIKAVADKLPTGISYMVFGPDVIYSIEVLSGGICWGNSTTGDGVLDISGWLKFDSEASAEAAMEDIEDTMSREFDATINDASLSGQFIEITGELQIPDS